MAAAIANHGVNVLLAAGLVLALPVAAHAAPDPKVAPPVAGHGAPDLRTQLDTEVAQHFRSDQPGAAVMVRKGDKVLLRKGYGMGDLARQRPVLPEQVFRLGSITKPFTAAAIMLLADEGKLSVDDDVRKYLPGYPTHDATITIEHLLTHTSGIPSYTDQPGFNRMMAQDIEPAALLDRFKDLPLEFVPGARMKYSNSGYHLLGLIIEKVSGQPYARFIAQRIFKPLGMTHSGYGDDPKLDRVQGYSRGKEGPPMAAPPISMKIPYAAGALVSSVDDLARWDSAIRAGKLLKKATWQRVFTAARLIDGRATDYGYGWSVGKLDGHPAQRHGGGIPGFATHLLRVPDEGLLVTVLLNSIPGPTDPALLAHRLAMIALGKPLVDPKVARVDGGVLDRYAGVYRSRDKGPFLVRRDGDHLTVQPPGGPRLEAWPESESRFFVKGQPLRFAFATGAGGTVSELAVTRPSGDVDRAARTSEKLPAERPAVTVSPEVLERYVGEYRLTPDFAITITRTGSQLFAQATHQPRHEIFPSGPGEFFLRAVDAQLSFPAKGNARAEMLIFRQNGRTMPGKRVR
jgi:D-alanyl-D-alanine carboxypeptidase